MMAGTNGARRRTTRDQSAMFAAKKQSIEHAGKECGMFTRRTS